VLPYLSNALSARKHSLDKSLLAVNFETMKDFGAKKGGGGYDTARVQHKRKSTVGDLNHLNRMKREMYLLNESTKQAFV